MLENHIQANIHGMSQKYYIDKYYMYIYYMAKYHTGYELPDF